MNMTQAMAQAIPILVALERIVVNQQRNQRDERGPPLLKIM